MNLEDQIRTVNYLLLQDPSNDWKLTLNADERRQIEISIDAADENNKKFIEEEARTKSRQKLKSDTIEPKDLPTMLVQDFLLDYITKSELKNIAKKNFGRNFIRIALLEYCKLKNISYVNDKEKIRDQSIQITFDVLSGVEKQDEFRKFKKINPLTDIIAKELIKSIKNPEVLSGLEFIDSKLGLKYLSVIDKLYSQIKDHPQYEPIQKLIENPGIYRTKSNAYKDYKTAKKQFDKDIKALKKDINSIRTKYNQIIINSKNKKDIEWDKKYLQELSIEAKRLKQKSIDKTITNIEKNIESKIKTYENSINRIKELVQEKILEIDKITNELKGTYKKNNYSLKSILEEHKTVEQIESKFSNLSKIKRHPELKDKFLMLDETIKLYEQIKKNISKREKITIDQELTRYNRRIISNDGNTRKKCDELKTFEKDINLLEQISPNSKIDTLKQMINHKIKTYKNNVEELENNFYKVNAFHLEVSDEQFYNNNNFISRIQNIKQEINGFEKNKKFCSYDLLLIDKIKELNNKKTKTLNKISELINRKKEYYSRLNEEIKNLSVPKTTQEKEYLVDLFNDFEELKEYNETFKFKLDIKVVEAITNEKIQIYDELLKEKTEEVTKLIKTIKEYDDLKKLTFDKPSQEIINTIQQVNELGKEYFRLSEYKKDNGLVNIVNEAKEETRKLIRMQKNIVEKIFDEAQDKVSELNKKYESIDFTRNNLDKAERLMSELEELNMKTSYLKVFKVLEKDLDEDELKTKLLNTIFAYETYNSEIKPMLDNELIELSNLQNPVFDTKQNITELRYQTNIFIKKYEKTKSMMKLSDIHKTTIGAGEHQIHFITENEIKKEATKLIRIYIQKAQEIYNQQTTIENIDELTKANNQKKAIDEIINEMEYFESHICNIKQSKQKVLNFKKEIIDNERIYEQILNNRIDNIESKIKTITHIKISDKLKTKKYISELEQINEEFHEYHRLKKEYNDSGIDHIFDKLEETINHKYLMLDGKRNKIINKLTKEIESLNKEINNYSNKGKLGKANYYFINKSNLSKKNKLIEQLTYIKKHHKSPIKYKIKESFRELNERIN